MKLAGFSSSARQRAPYNGISSDESAVVSIFVSITFLAFLAVLSLLSDGAAIRNNRRKLADLAGQAARVAAQEIDLNILRASGELRLDFTRAKNTALAVLEYEEIQGEVQVLNDAVVVAAYKKVELWGGREINLKAQRTARATTNFLSDPASVP